MAEKLRIYRSLRYGSAVYREVFSALAGAVLMNDPRYVFLSDTAFSGNKHRDVGRSHSDSDLKGSVQRRIVADYIIFVL